MRDNREKWRFYIHPAKPPLKAEAVRYWKNALTKLLKVGIEFEFNLPEQKGVCKGDNVHCPCIYINDGCWQECLNHKKCESTPYIETCANRTEDCTPDKCEHCDSYKLKCLGTNCIEFVSKCFDCDKFDKNCETCPKKYNPDRDPNKIREHLKMKLQPSGDYGSKMSPSGVVNITTDGSLVGGKGVEIITLGRRPDYWEFFQMSKKILDLCKNKGAYLDERCSSHMHLLTSYYNGGPTGIINELEKSMPEIIVANFHQLCRRYQNAITWMTMALDKPNSMTRWEKFRVSILEISPVQKSMSNVNAQICRKSSHLSNKEKYGWVNYCNTIFRNNVIDNFHVEVRVADSTMCPSYYAGIACLLYSLLIKAAEISRYGVLKIGNEEWLEKAKRIKKAILNNTGGYDGPRTSNTKHVLKYREELEMSSVEMLNQLKGVLLKLGPAYDVLIKLAQKPVALRRIEGDTWEDIENDLAVDMRDADQVEFRINEIIDLQYIEDCNNIKEWIKEVSKIVNDINDTENPENQLEITTDDIETFIETKMRDGDLIWSNTTGSVIAI